MMGHTMNNPGLTCNVSIPPEFIQAIGDYIVERLRPLLKEGKDTDNNIILDVKGLASYLNVTEEWIRKKARDNEIPCFKTGKYYKFRQREIDKHIQKSSFVSMLPLKRKSVRCITDK